MSHFLNLSSGTELPLLSGGRPQPVTLPSGKKSLCLSSLFIAMLCVFFISYSNQSFSLFRPTSVRLNGHSLHVSIPTRDCDTGLYCKAVLLIARAPDGWEFFAGYFIYSMDPDLERDVPSTTRARVQKVTEAEAKSWATYLINYLSAKMDISNTSLTADDIASGIMKQKDVAATCTRTTNIKCNAVEVVSTLAV